MSTRSRNMFNNNSGSTAESVNGKIDLGFRKLIVSHVENACTIYAYTAADHHFLDDYKKKLSELYQAKPEPVDGPVRPDVMYGVRSPKSRAILRGRVEQGPGPNKNDLVRMRIVDLGMTEFVPRSDIFDFGSAISVKEMPIYCNRYKMTDLKPKGQVEGFSAKERAQGAEWLKSVIGDRPIKAKCHEVVNYKGGIWFEGEVEGKNLNLLAAQSGFCVPNPSTLLKTDSVNHKALAHWDQDYFEYGQRQNYGPLMCQPHLTPSANGSGGVGSATTPNSISQKSPISIGNFWLDNRRKSLEPIVPPMVSNQQKDLQDEVTKLKKTLKTLESALSKRKKEIEELKKNPGNATDSNVDQFNLTKLVSVISKAEMLRRERKNNDIVEPTNDIDKAKDIQKKVADTAELLRKTFDTLRRLSEMGDAAEEKWEKFEKMSKSSKSSDDPNEVDEEEDDMVDNEDGDNAVEDKPAVPADAAIVAKEAIEDFLNENDRLSQTYEEGCTTLEHILTHEVDRPVVKPNVSQMTLGRRTELVNEGVELGLKWAKNCADQSTKKPPSTSAAEASKMALDNFCAGLEDVCSTVKAVNEGQPLQKPIPSLTGMIKRTQTTFENEIATYNNNGNNIKNKCALGYLVLAKAIGVCLDERSRVLDRRDRFLTLVDAL